MVTHLVELASCLAFFEFSWASFRVPQKLVQHQEPYRLQTQLSKIVPGNFCGKTFGNFCTIGRSFNLSSISSLLDRPFLGRFCLLISWLSMLGKRKGMTFAMIHDFLLLGVWSLTFLPLQYILAIFLDNQSIPSMISKSNTTSYIRSALDVWLPILILQYMNFRIFNSLTCRCGYSERLNQLIKFIS